MHDQDEKDRKLAQIMLNSRIEMSAPDMESLVMSKIYNDKKIRMILKSKRLAALFLAIEILLGLFINFTMARFQDTILGLSPMILTGLFQVGFFILIFIQCEQFLSPKEK